MLMVLVYATCPPRQWGYWVVKPGGHCWPTSRVRSVIVDNGAFGFYSSGRYPSLEKWIALLLRTAYRVRSLAEEVIVVLPDYVLDPARTALAAKRAAGTLCRLYRCMYVMHWNTDYMEYFRDYFLAQMLDVEADIYAVPLKLPTMTRYSERKRSVVADTVAQATVALDAAAAAQELSTMLHLLAPSTRLLRLLAATGWPPRVRSIDTTAWTRPVNTRVKKQLGTISARTQRERELLFNAYLDHLRSLGIEIET